jgi:hypothetical protein
MLMSAASKRVVNRGHGNAPHARVHVALGAHRMEPGSCPEEWFLASASTRHDPNHCAALAAQQRTLARRQAHESPGGCLRKHKGARARNPG